jgi:hypothetical protein
MMMRPISSARPRPRLRFGVVAVATATVLSACYDYLPPASGAVTPGAEVQATLTDAGSVQVASEVGPRVASITGRVERAGTDTLVLRVSSTGLMNGGDNGWNGERVAIPTSAIASVRQKELSPTRTAIAAVVAVGAIVFAIAKLHGGSSDAPPPVVLGPPPVGQ